MNIETELRVAAQIALLGEVPVTLRSVSIQVELKNFLLRAILESKATEADRESLSCVFTEILASLSSECTVDEEILCFDGSLKERELSLLVFRRKEAS